MGNQLLIIVVLVSLLCNALFALYFFLGKSEVPESASSSPLQEIEETTQNNSEVVQDTDIESETLEEEIEENGSENIPDAPIPEEEVEEEIETIEVPEDESILKKENEELEKLSEKKGNMYYVYEYLQNKDIKICDKIVSWDYVEEISELCKNSIKDNKIDEAYIREFALNNMWDTSGDFVDLANIAYNKENSCAAIDRDLLRYFECKSMIDTNYDVLSGIRRFETALRVDRDMIDANLEAVLEEYSLEKDIIPLFENTIDTYYASQEQ